MTRDEMERFFVDSKGAPYRVSDVPVSEDWVPLPLADLRRAAR
jgi:hypothetical protein